MKTGFDRLAYDDALALLWERIDYERASGVVYGESEYKLDRMRELLARLGDPQSCAPIVHVAGTKGKGSTAAMTAAVLSAAGYRTGLFSSPHLNRVEERMAIDGQPCPEAEFTELAQRLRPIVAEMDAQAAQTPGEVGPTYFELTTALALLHFAAQRVDVMVLEVGMGGRLDSTNVCTSAVSVITSISFDHTRQLGPTLTLIAREKAGIIKPGVPVVSGVLPDEPRRVIEEVSRQQQSQIVQLGRDFDFVYRPPRRLELEPQLGRLDYTSQLPDQPRRELRDLALGLLGRHQAANAAVALAAVEQLTPRGIAVSEDAMRHGLAQVRWPARVEVVRRRPTVVIDASHNLASVAALLETLDESFSPSRRTLVFAGTKEKDTRGMLSLLLPRFERVIFTRYLNNPRHVPAEELLALAQELGATHCSVAADPAAAWKAVVDAMRRRRPDLRHRLVLHRRRNAG